MRADGRLRWLYWKAGVCGKTTEVAELQDQLTGALVGLSRAVDNAPDTNEGTWRLMIEGLFTTVTNVNFNEKTILDLIDRVHAEKARLVPNCYSCTSRCGRNDDYDMHLLWSAQEDVRSLKSLILLVRAAWRPTPITPWYWAMPMRR